jgi:hypothetical protein
MRRDFRLYELNDDEFERLIVRICVKWLGAGVTPFAPGKDGGRDGKFHGTATCFPSTAAPISGHVVLQAKHVAAPDKSCSDRDFGRLMRKEHPKIKLLVARGICDHYIAFTNRKLTAGAEPKLVAPILLMGAKTASFIGVERLHMALEEHSDIRETLPNLADQVPFRFNHDDLIEVIGAVHDYVYSTPDSGFDSAHDFDAVHIRDVKNKLNGLSEDYHDQIIVAGSMPHFAAIDAFLRNPRNRALATLYHDAADELKTKILTKRAEFDAFDEVFAFIYEAVQEKRTHLKGKRRMISIVVHYMYCNCDIGSKSLIPIIEGANANS